MAKLVLIDFDGTITTKDTLFAFARYTSSSFKYWMLIFLLLPSFVLMKVGVLKKQKGKELFLSLFFGDCQKDYFLAKCDSFNADKLQSIVRDKAIEIIQSYKRRGDRVVIVSASPEYWIKPWASQMGLEVIATKLEFKADRITGKIDGQNCNGIEKVNRINGYLDLKNFDQVIAYGDSEGDKPMFSIAHETHFKPFR